MADAEDIARIVEEQRAKPADLLAAEVPNVPQPEPAPEPAPEAEDVPAPEPGPDALAPEPEPAPAEAKVKKSPVAHLTGRIGNLTAKLNESDAARQAAESRLAAAEALLNARRAQPAPDGEQPAPANVNPATGRTYSQTEFDQAVQAAAEQQAFNRQADAVFSVGAAAFPTDWQETVDVLNGSGIMSKTLVDATFALGDEKLSAAVLHRLGSDIEEAKRIADMAATPARMGVELAKIAAEVNRPAAAPRTSSAPAPIPTIRGGVNPVIDYAKLAEGDTNDMSAYAAARRRAGDPWAMSRKERAAMARGA